MLASAKTTSAPLIHPWQFRDLNPWSQFRCMFLLYLVLIWIKHCKAIGPPKSDNLYFRTKHPQLILMVAHIYIYNFTYIIIICLVSGRLSSIPFLFGDGYGGIKGYIITVIMGCFNDYNWDNDGIIIGYNVVICGRNLQWCLLVWFQHVSTIYLLVNMTMQTITVSHG